MIKLRHLLTLCPGLSLIDMFLTAGEVSEALMRMAWLARYWVRPSDCFCSAGDLFCEAWLLYKPASIKYEVWSSYSVVFFSDCHQDFY